MANKAVSIVIPTFNRAEYLKAAIASSLSQTFTCEVIVVDHGSSDATPAVAAEWKERVQYIRRERDFGPHFCWLEGVLHAKGDFIHLQFDDDWIKPTFVEKCMSVFADDCGFAFSGAEIYFEDTKLLKHLSHSTNMPPTGIHRNATLERIILGSLISPASAIFRRDILLDALYQGRLPLASDSYHGVGPDCFVTLLSMLRYPRIGYVAEDLAVFRAHAGSITIDAKADKSRSNGLNSAYREVKRHYKELKYLKIWRSLTARKHL